MVTTEDRPKYLRECCFCQKFISIADEDQVCPENSGDKHVLWMSGKEMFDKETTNEH